MSKLLENGAPESLQLAPKYLSSAQCAYFSNIRCRSRLDLNWTWSRCNKNIFSVDLHCSKFLAIWLVQICRVIIFNRSKGTKFTVLESFLLKIFVSDSFILVHLAINIKVKSVFYCRCSERQNRRRLIVLALNSSELLSRCPTNRKQ